MNYSKICVMEWTFLLTFKYYISKCEGQYLIKYIRMHHLECTYLDPFS